MLRAATSCVGFLRLGFNAWQPYAAVAVNKWISRIHIPPLLRWWSGRASSPAEFDIRVMQCNGVPQIDVPEEFQQPPILGHCRFRLDGRAEVREGECFLGFCNRFGHIVFQDRADHAKSRETVARPFIWTPNRRRLFIYWSFLLKCRLQLNRRLLHLNRRPFAKTKLRLQPGSLAT